MVVRLAAVLLAAGGLPLTLAAEEPAFLLGLEGCPSVIEGQPGEVRTFEVLATLTASGPEGPGAEGWSIALTAVQGTIKAITLEGVRIPVLRDDDGDPETPSVADEMELSSAQEASAGLLPSDPRIAVSTVLLDGTGRVTLPPSGKFVIARMTIEIIVPRMPLCIPIEMFQTYYVYDRPEDNRVRRLGTETTVPHEVDCQAVFPPCTLEHTLALVPAGEEPPADGDFLLERTVPAGDYRLAVEVLLTSYHSLDEKEGPRGWSLSFEHGSSCMTVEEITVEGLHVQTIFDHDGDPSTPDLDPYDHDLSDSSLLLMQKAHGGPGTGLPETVRGVVAACILNNQMKMVLPLNSTARILRIVYSIPVAEGTTTDCFVRFRDGLRGLGEPFSNSAFYPTASLGTRTRGLVLRLTGGEPPYRIGDANADGQVDLSDAVFILDNLFLGGPRPSCRKTGDLDDNGSPEITDPIFLLSHLFLGGPPPVEPGVCRPDRTPDALGCISYPPCE